MSADGPSGTASAAPSSGQHQHVEHQQHHQQQQLQQQSTSIGAHPTPTSNPPTRLSVHDIRNSDLVSRLLAATPPYLYSSPVGPQNFFFSDMLRSLVQSKHVEAANRSAAAASAAANCSQPSSSSAAAAASAVLGAHHPTAIGSAPAGGRRPRKRTWGQTRMTNSALSTGLLDIGQKVINLNNNIDVSDNKLASYENKPLELTNKCSGSPPYKYAPHHSHMPPEKLMRHHQQHNSGKSPPESDSKHPHDSAGAFNAVSILNNNNNTIPSGEHPMGLVAPNSSSGELVLPPPPPMWYPPLYPPYGIDPLHFFIDLRVSGHIYDRKKENTSPNGSAVGVASSDRPTPSSSLSHDVCDVTSARPRFGSAFSVPQSRRDKSPNSRALNLTSSPTPVLTPDNNSGKHNASSSAASAAAAAASALYTHHTTYDHTLMDAALKDAAAKNNTNYVLQNLPRIYTDLGAQQGGGTGADGRNSTNSDETTDSKSDADAQEQQQQLLNLGGECGGMDASNRGDEERDDNDDDSGDVVIVDGKHHSSY